MSEALMGILKDFPFGQMAVVCLVRFAEPIAFTSFLPYVYSMVRDFDVAADEAQIARYAGYLAASFCVCEVGTSFLWGRFSDKHGRKPTLIIGLVGSMLSLLILGFAKHYHWALFARSLMGLLNGNVSVIRTAIGEIATKRRHQALAFSTMPVVWQVGSVFGPLIGGFLPRPSQLVGAQNSSFIEKHPYALPNLALCCVLFGSLLITVFCLEETHHKLKYRRDPFVNIYDIFRKKVGRRVKRRPWHPPELEGTPLLHDDVFCTTSYINPIEEIVMDKSNIKGMEEANVAVQTGHKCQGDHQNHDDYAHGDEELIEATIDTEGEEFFIDFDGKVVPPDQIEEVYIHRDGREVPGVKLSGIQDDGVPQDDDRQGENGDDPSNLDSDDADEEVEPANDNQFGKVVGPAKVIKTLANFKSDTNKKVITDVVDKPPNAAKDYAHASDEKDAAEKVMAKSETERASREKTNGGKRDGKLHKVVIAGAALYFDQSIETKPKISLDNSSTGKRSLRERNQGPENQEAIRLGETQKTQEETALESLESQTGEIKSSKKVGDTGHDLSEYAEFAVDEAAKVIKKTTVSKGITGEVISDVVDKAAGALKDYIHDADDQVKEIVKDAVMEVKEEAKLKKEPEMVQDGFEEVTGRVKLYVEPRTELEVPSDNSRADPRTREYQESKIVGKEPSQSNKNEAVSYVTREEAESSKSIKAKAVVDKLNAKSVGKKKDFDYAGFLIDETAKVIKKATVSEAITGEVVADVVDKAAEAIKGYVNTDKKKVAVQNANSDSDPKSTEIESFANEAAQQLPQEVFSGVTLTVQNLEVLPEKGTGDEAGIDLLSEPIESIAELKATMKDTEVVAGVILYQEPDKQDDSIILPEMNEEKPAISGPSSISSGSGAGRPDGDSRNDSTPQVGTSFTTDMSNTIKNSGLDEAELSDGGHLSDYAEFVVDEASKVAKKLAAANAGVFSEVVCDVLDKTSDVAKTAIHQHGHHSTELGDASNPSELTAEDICAGKSDEVEEAFTKVSKNEPFSEPTKPKTSGVSEKTQEIKLLPHKAVKVFEKLDVTDPAVIKEALVNVSGSEVFKEIDEIPKNSESIEDKVKQTQQGKGQETVKKNDGNLDEYVNFAVDEAAKVVKKIATTKPGFVGQVIADVTDKAAEALKDYVNNDDGEKTVTEDTKGQNKNETEAETITKAPKPDATPRNGKSKMIDAKKVANIPDEKKEITDSTTLYVEHDSKFAAEMQEEKRQLQAANYRSRTEEEEKTDDQSVSKLKAEEDDDKSDEGHLSDYVEFAIDTAAKGFKNAVKSRPDGVTIGEAIDQAAGYLKDYVHASETENETRNDDGHEIEANDAKETEEQTGGAGGYVTIDVVKDDEKSDEEAAELTIDFKNETQEPKDSYLSRFEVKVPKTDSEVDTSADVPAKTDKITEVDRGQEEGPEGIEEESSKEDKCKEKELKDDASVLSFGDAAENAVDEVAQIVKKIAKTKADVTEEVFSDVVDKVADYVKDVVNPPDEEHGSKACFKKNDDDGVRGIKSVKFSQRDTKELTEDSSNDVVNDEASEVDKGIKRSSAASNPTGKTSQSEAKVITCACSSQKNSARPSGTSGKGSKVSLLLPDSAHEFFSPLKQSDIEEGIIHPQPSHLSAHVAKTLEEPDSDDEIRNVRGFISKSHSERLISQSKARKGDSFQGNPKEIMKPGIISALVCGFILSLHSVVVDEFLPVFLSSDVARDENNRLASKFPWNVSGGLNYTTEDIGSVLSTTGGIGVFVMCVIFPYFDTKYDCLSTYKNCVRIFPIIYFLLPYIVFLADTPWLAKPTIYFLSCLKAAAVSIATPQILLIIHNSADPDKRAMVNGLNISVTELARFIGPMVWGGLMSFGQENGANWIGWWLLV